MDCEWQPSATMETLKFRASTIQKIRQFFTERHYLEVETPILAEGTLTDPHIESIETAIHTGNGKQQRYLQTSPEFHMKRLLAAGSGPIFQISRVFRNNESGRHHNTEFSLLEWYQPGFNHHDLMNEMDGFLQCILHSTKADRVSYSDLFLKYCDIEPLTASENDVFSCAVNFGLDDVKGIAKNDKDTWLELLISHVIEPNLGQNNQPTFIYDYPASQASLACLRDEKGVTVAERFEVYFSGLELANGFNELTDAAAQKQRFENENWERQQKALTELYWDRYLIAALQHGLPQCAGVALGIDRLVMLAAKENDIAKVMSFSQERA